MGLSLAFISRLLQLRYMCLFLEKLLDEVLVLKRSMVQALNKVLSVHFLKRAKLVPLLVLEIRKLIANGQLQFKKNLLLERLGI